MENRPSLLRLYALAVPLLLLGFFIGFRLLHIQWVEGDELRAEAEKNVVRNIAIKAKRGSIFSSDGKLLATNMPVYHVHFDPTVASDEVFNEGIADMCLGLETLVDKERSSTEWQRLLTSMRRNNKQYITLSRSVDHSTLKALKALPILKQGRYKGGLITVQVDERKHPLGKIAERTVGYDEDFRKFGLEHAYTDELKGKDGTRLAQMISPGKWKPLTDHFSVEPIDGADLISTIDTRLQDIAHQALEDALEWHDADHGCAVLMEVKTGAVRAIVNLGHSSEGTSYYEKRNYAVWESTEPGSTFKTIAMMAALEDELIDTGMVIDTRNGIYEPVPGYKVKDSNVKNGKGGYGKINLSTALKKSSNTAIVKALYGAYKNKPDRFVDRMYALGLDRRLGLEFKGEGKPKIPSDFESDELALPWMFFGYGVSFTPLQLLSMYNAIANDGVMIRPRFVERLEVMGKTTEQIETEVLYSPICSEPTLAQLRHILYQVVAHKEGTAHNIYSDQLSMAGKTGTCQLNYWSRDNGLEYQASFVGYFPAEKPEYSCIVVINKPRQNGYYGSTVAAPVFEKIAHGTRRLTPLSPDQLPKTDIPINSVESEGTHLAALEQSRMPNMRGMRLSEAIELMENHGLKVKLYGFAGKVRSQWPRAGEALPPARTIILEAG